MLRLIGAGAFVLVATSLLAQSSGSAEAALRRLWGQFEEAFNRGDADKVAGLYAIDGDRINSDLELAKGRTEIAKQYEKEFASRRADPSTVPFHAKLEIRLLSRDVALLDGEWEGFRVGKKFRARFTVIAQKAGSGWQIAAGRVGNRKEL